MQPVSLTAGNQEFIAPVAIYLLAKSAGSNINFTTYELPFITKIYSCRLLGLMHLSVLSSRAGWQGIHGDSPNI